MKCYRFDYQRQIPRFLDGELNAQKSDRLLAHIQMCGDCSLRFKQMSAARELYQLRTPVTSCMLMRAASTNNRAGIALITRLKLSGSHAQEARYGSPAVAGGKPLPRSGI